MSDDRTKPSARPGPQTAPIGSQPKLPRRFYKDVTAHTAGDEGCEIKLDDRVVKTPKRNPLHVPTMALADAIKDEWSAQGEHINPETMPLTKLVNTGLDGIKGTEQAIVTDVARFATNDMLCYRASHPKELVARQEQAWNPILEWASRELDTKLILTTGINHVTQPAHAATNIERALESYDALALAAIHVMTTLTGSAVLTLAHARGHLDLTDAWTAAHIDEDYQIEQWGEDNEAKARRAYRLSEFTNASRLLDLLRQ